MKSSVLLFTILSVLILSQSSCGKKKVIGDVHVYGSITDAYDNAPVSNVQLRLYKGDQKSNDLMEHSVDINASTGAYDVKYFTAEKAKKGYTFVATPLGTEEYYFKDYKTSGDKRIYDNDCPYDIVLERMGYMKVRLIDVPPLNYLSYPEFHCDGNQYPLNVSNFSGDETFIVKLIPAHDNFYELTSRTSNYTDTIIAGNINMDYSGDTLYQTLQF